MGQFSTTMKTSWDFSMKILVLFCLTKTIFGTQEDNEISGKSLEKSLAQMFNAYKAASLETSQQNQEDLKKSFIQKYFHSHRPETENMYHDGPGGHQQHHHNHGTESMYHDGRGGHPHDDDGHTHQQHHQQNNHHLDDGHNHGKSTQNNGQHQKLEQQEKKLPNDVAPKSDTTNNHEQQEAARVKSEKKALRELTLTISKLLFHLSQTTTDA